MKQKKYFCFGIRQKKHFKVPVNIIFINVLFEIIVDTYKAQTIIFQPQKQNKNIVIVEILIKAIDFYLIRPWWKAAEQLNKEFILLFLTWLYFSAHTCNRNTTAVLYSIHKTPSFFLKSIYSAVCVFVLKLAVYFPIIRLHFFQLHLCANTFNRIGKLLSTSFIMFQQLAVF